MDRIYVFFLLFAIITLIILGQVLDKNFVAAAAGSGAYAACYNTVRAVPRRSAVNPQTLSP